MRRLACLIPIAALTSLAQPLISPRGIVSAASFTPSGLPNGPIARGAFFSIFGTRFAFSPAGVGNYPLSNTVGGISVLVKQGNTTVNAIPYAVSSTLVNAIMPSNAPLGQVSVQVVVNGNTVGPPSPVVVVNAGFKAFTWGPGYGPALAQTFANGQFLGNNTPSTPAQPGQVIALYGTGLGPVTYADNIQPTAGNLPTQVEVWVGGMSVQPTYAGRNGCCSAFDQINFVLPQNVPTGCWVPVTVRTAGSIMSNTVTLAISPDGSACSDPLNPLAQTLLTGGRFGIVGLLRTAVHEDVGLLAAGDIVTDTAMMTFQQENFGGIPQFHPIFSLPPAGACNMYMTSGDLIGGETFPGGGTTGKYFDAGKTITVTAGSSSITLPRPADNSRNFQPLGFSATLQGSSTLAVPSTLFLNPGIISVSGPGGGANVQAFQAQVTLPSSFGALSWTNRDQISPINRNNPLTLNWSGAPANQPVIVFGGSSDLPSNGAGIFVCVAAPGSTSFTIPNYILQGVPPTRTNLRQSKGVIYVGTLATVNPATFSAGGLDIGLVIPGSFVGKTVIFQ